MKVGVALHRVLPGTGMARSPNPLGLIDTLERVEAFLEDVSHAWGWHRPDAPEDADRSDILCPVLTVDDATLDFAEYLHPVIRRLQIPVLIAITSGYARRGSLPWWDRLWDLLVARLGEPTACPLLERYTIQFPGKESLFQGFPALVEALKEIPHEKMLTWLALEERGGGIPQAGDSLRRALSWDELRQLDPEWVTWAFHGREHSLPVSRGGILDGEIREGLKEMRSHCPGQIRDFVYPNGTWGDQSSSVRQICQREGLERGWLLGHAGALGMRMDSMLLPRINLVHWDGKESPRCFLKRRWGELSDWNSLEAYRQGSRDLGGGDVRRGHRLMKRVHEDHEARTTWRGGAAYHLAVRAWLDGRDAEAVEWIHRAAVICPEHQRASRMAALVESRRKEASGREGELPDRVVLAYHTLNDNGIATILGTLAEGLAPHVEIEVIQTGNSAAGVTRSLGQWGPVATRNDPWLLAGELQKRSRSLVVVAPNQPDLWWAMRAAGVPCMGWSVRGMTSPCRNNVCINPKPPRGWTYCPDPIFPQSWQGTTPRRRWDEGSWIIGTAARLSPVKGLKYLIRAVSYLHEWGFPDVRLHLLLAQPRAQAEGLELTREEVEAWCHKDLPQGTWHVGYERDVRPWLAGWNQAVCASVSEGLPLLALDAALAKVPLIGTEVGYLSSFMGQGRRGWQVPPRDSVQLARVLAEARQNPRASRGRVRRAERHVRQHHDLERVVSIWLKLLRRGGS